MDITYPADDLTVRFPYRGQDGGLLLGQRGQNHHIDIRRRMHSLIGSGHIYLLSVGEQPHKYRAATWDLEVCMFGIR